MTQKDKELPLKDLCARLPYSVKVEYKGEEYEVLGIAHGRLVLCKPFMSYTLNEHPLVEEVKPYLFPITSMTEGQRNEYHELVRGMFGTGVLINFEVLEEFFHKNHIDYRGLIPMGLALDATYLNIY